MKLLKIILTSVTLLLPLAVNATYVTQSTLDNMSVGDSLYVATNLTLHSYTITGSPSPVPEVDLWGLLVVLVGWVMLGIAIRFKWL